MNDAVSFDSQPVAEHPDTDFAARVAVLQGALDDEQVLADAASCAYDADAIFWQPGVAPSAIVLPRNRAQSVMQPESWAALTAIQRVFDPQGRVNPRSLGLRAPR